MNAYVCAGAGFLLAVLWFDLMHDVQVLLGEPDAAAVLSIARYYRRVTTDARPMNRLVALVMVATLVAVVIEVVGDEVDAWVAWTSLVLVVVPITVAATRTVPNAVRLGADVDRPTPEHAAVARSIGRDHLVCLVFITALLVVQLGWG